MQKKTAGPLRERETLRLVAVSLSADRRSVINSRSRLMDLQGSSAGRILSTNRPLGKEKETLAEYWKENRGVGARTG